MAHFEIHAGDLEAAKRFYHGLFGWSFSAMPGVEGYFLVESQDIGLGKGLTAALMARTNAPHDAGSAVRGGTMTFEVDDCDARYAWALENGGAEALPPADYPGIGRCAYVEDGFGNIVGMIAPVKGEH